MWFIGTTDYRFFYTASDKLTKPAKYKIYRYICSRYTLIQWKVQILSKEVLLLWGAEINKPVDLFARWSYSYPLPWRISNANLYIYKRMWECSQIFCYYHHNWGPCAGQPIYMQMKNIDSKKERDYRDLCRDGTGPWHLSITPSTTWLIAVIGVIQPLPSNLSPPQPMPVEIPVVMPMEIP